MENKKYSFRQIHDKALLDKLYFQTQNRKKTNTTLNLDEAQLDKLEEKLTEFNVLYDMKLRKTDLFNAALGLILEKLQKDLKKFKENTIPDAEFLERKENLLRVKLENTVNERRQLEIKFPESAENDTSVDTPAAPDNNDNDTNNNWGYNNENQ